MDKIISGIHHVTAITADAQANIDFYCGVLGLRLVKLTVNFDDPASYHLYYGDELGRPGTIMTFFAWPGAPRGRIGPPQVTATAFSVPAEAYEFWAAHLSEHGVDIRSAETRFGDEVLAFDDPDGNGLEIVATGQASRETPFAGTIPAAHAIRGFHGITISEEGHEKTAKLLTDVMGFASEGNAGNRFRFRAAGGGSVVDLVCAPQARHGVLGAGVVHHVAYRTPDDDQQAQWRSELVKLDYNVSPVMDRRYFHSIYYREPGGVLFEIATDSPGFTADESPELLGTKLMLPPWFEPHREKIEKMLPPLRLPGWRRQARAA